MMRWLPQLMCILPSLSRSLTSRLCAIYQNLALGRGLQSADNIEQGGLTAAGRADNTDKLIFMNIHIHAVEGHHLTVAAVKLLDDVVDMYLYC